MAMLGDPPSTVTIADLLSNRSFRVPLYMAIAMPVITLVAELFLLVESPYWLMLRGRREDARKSLAFLNPNSTAEQLDLAVDTLSYTIAKDAEEHLAVRRSDLVPSIASDGH